MTGSAVHPGREKNQIDGLQHNIVQLADELKGLHRHPVLYSGLGTRIQSMLKLAEEEAQSIVHEAKTAAEAGTARAEEEARELANAAQDCLTKAKAKAEEMELECARLLNEARKEADNVTAEAIKVREEAESEKRLLHERAEAFFESEIEQNRQQAETLIRDQEDEALREAELIITTARSEATKFTRRAESLVEEYRDEYERIELSRNTSVLQMVAIKDSLEVLIRACDRGRTVPELEPRIDYNVRT